MSRSGASTGDGSPGLTLHPHARYRRRSSWPRRPPGQPAQRKAPPCAVPSAADGVNRDAAIPAAQSPRRWPRPNRGSLLPAFVAERQAGLRRVLFDEVAVIPTYSACMAAGRLRRPAAAHVMTAIQNEVRARRDDFLPPS